jgi:hypothetical protein
VQVTDAAVSLAERGPGVDLFFSYQLLAGVQIFRIFSQLLINTMWIERRNMSLPWKSWKSKERIPVFEAHTTVFRIVLVITCKIAVCAISC